MLATLQSRLGYASRLAAVLYACVALILVGFGAYALSRFEDGCKTGTGVPGAPSRCRKPSLTSPGNCPYFGQGTRFRIGLIVHLALIVPASFLVCFQFVPIIRRNKPCVVSSRLSSPVQSHPPMDRPLHRRPPPRQQRGGADDHAVDVRRLGRLAARDRLARDRDDGQHRDRHLRHPLHASTR